MLTEGGWVQKGPAVEALNEPKDVARPSDWKNWLVGGVAVAIVLAGGMVAYFMGGISPAEVDAFVYYVVVAVALFGLSAFVSAFVDTERKSLRHVELLELRRRALLMGVCLAVAGMLHLSWNWHYADALIRDARKAFAAGLYKKAEQLYLQAQDKAKAGFESEKQSAFRVAIKAAQEAQECKELIARIEESTGSARRTADDARRKAETKLIDFLAQWTEDSRPINPCAYEG